MLKYKARKYDIEAKSSKRRFQLSIATLVIKCSFLFLVIKGNGLNHFI